MNYDYLIKNFKQELFNNTYSNLTKHVGTTVKGQTYTLNQAKNDANVLTNETLMYMETLLTTGLIDENSFDRVFSNLNQNLNNIDFLPIEQRGLYGLADASKRTIYINPELSDNRRRLYLFHELAHASYQHKNTAPYINGYMRHSTYYGYMTIEEALAQNIAETCYYSSINQARPLKRQERDKCMPNVTYHTNFDYYGLYQPLAANFGRVLRGVGTSSADSDDKILFDLCKKSLKEDLLDSVIKEYTDDGIGNCLEPMFYSLANVYAGKKNSFGMGGIVERVFDENQRLVASKELNPTPQETQNHYVKAMQLMKSNEDYRNPIKE